MRLRDVAHAEDPAGHAIGMEDVEVFELLAGGGEEDRLAGDLADAQRGTTAGVAVELGEDDTGDADSLTESVGRADRVLTDHCVEDEDGLVLG